jgi:hypothetical protein
MENDCLSTIELAERLGVTPGRVRQIALSLGLSRKGRDWLFTAEDIEKIAGHTRVGVAGSVMVMTAPARRKK